VPLGEEVQSRECTNDCLLSHRDSNGVAAPRHTWTDAFTDRSTGFGSRILPHDVLGEEPELANDHAQQCCTQPRLYSLAAITLVGLAVSLGAARACVHWSSPAGGDLASGNGRTYIARDSSVSCKQVACIGTSITKGNVRVAGGDIASQTPYSAVLQELLGSDYCVHNLAAPGTTVVQETKKPYRRSVQWQKLLQMDPDVIIMQFGHVDTLESSFAARFSPDFKDMINVLKALPARPSVYVLSNTPIYPGTAMGHSLRMHDTSTRAYGMDIAVVNRLHAKLEKIAEESDIAPPISVFSLFRRIHCRVLNLKCYIMSQDGVHPNDEGDRMIGKIIALTIQGDDRCMANSDEDRLPCPAIGNNGVDLLASVTEMQCRSNGCCFDAAALSPSRRCYRKLEPVRATPEACSVERMLRTSCGFHSESKETCLARGCCYHMGLDGTPWCYHTLKPAFTRFKPITTTATTTTTTPLVTMTVTTRTTTTPTTTFTSTKTGTSVTTVTSVTLTGTSTTITLTSVTLTSTTTTTTLNLIETGEKEGEHAFMWVRKKFQGVNKYQLFRAMSLTLLIPLAVVLALAARAAFRVWRQMALPIPPNADRQLHQADEEQRQLHRLEIDMALRGVEDRAIKRGLHQMLSSAGFSGVNEPKEETGMFKSGYTFPLHAAVKANSVEAVTMLLRSNADINLADSKKRTPLMLAEQLNKKDSHKEVIVALRDV